MHPMRNAHARQTRAAIRRGVENSDAYAFFNLLTADESLDQVDALLPAHRERLYPPTETLSMFMAQALNADRSCQKAVNDFVGKRVAGGLLACSTRTGGFCRARQRLPEAMVSTLTRQIGQTMAAKAPPEAGWRGRRVRLVDGTTVSMPDTDANQAAYPQPASQKPGLGFPLCRLAGLICLSSGALLDSAIGRYQGKGGDEQSLLRTMLARLEAGDILLGDAFFATYFLLCELHNRGVDGVFEQHGSRRRSTDFRRGRRLGQRDHVIDIVKPKVRPSWMSAAQYSAAPDHLSVRELRVGGKTLVTTMLCDKQAPKGELKTLYKQRWHVELDLRNIKTTLGMDRLSGKSPGMATKEIWVYLLAYNLIRRTMAKAALKAGTLPRRISFKHTLQLWLVWHQRGLDSADDVATLLRLIAQNRVGDRPGRIEPRAVKRRPKPFPLLTSPRCIARERVRRKGHAKKLK